MNAYRTSLLRVTPSSDRARDALSRWLRDLKEMRAILSSRHPLLTPASGCCDGAFPLHAARSIAAPEAKLDFSQQSDRPKRPCDLGLGFRNKFALRSSHGHVHLGMIERVPGVNDIYRRMPMLQCPHHEAEAHHTESAAAALETVVSGAAALYLPWNFAALFCAQADCPSRRSSER